MATPDWLEALKSVASQRVKRFTKPGYGKDVELPLEGGKRDPRLASVPDQVKEAIKGGQQLRDIVKKYQKK